MYEDTSSSGGEPKGSFEIFKAEGDVLFKQQEYKKALKSYVKALDLKPGDKNCLVARSQCFLQLGDADKALLDANETLEEDPNFIKGLLQKAEALYLKGDFEMALVFYHRGNKLRPEVEGFRLGIQKCQEAINNSIGDDAGIRLEAKGDLTYFHEEQQTQQKTKSKQKQSGYSKPSAVKEEKKDKRRSRSSRNKDDPKTMKELLGELYADHEYLEKMVEDIERVARPTDKLLECREAAIDCLEYLDSRTEFWRQQKPMYSRKRDKALRDGVSSRASSTGGQNSKKWITKQLEAIDNAQERGDYEWSLNQSKKVMKRIENWSEDDIPERKEYTAHLHSYIGNAYLELGDYKNALRHHQLDREIAEQQDIEDAKSRSMDNLGRVYARMGEYRKAIEVWKDKAPLSNSPLETTWLNHEIGRCHLELGEFEAAREYGEKSMKCAQEANDQVWQLNASVLVAQSYVKLNELQQALDQFETSLDIAKAQGDEPAETAIKKAIDDVNNRIAKGLKENGEEEQSADNEQQQEDAHAEQEANYDDDFEKDTSSQENTARSSGSDTQKPAHDDQPSESQPETDHENATHEDAQYSSTHSQFSYDEEEEQAKSCYGESFEEEDPKQNVEATDEVNNTTERTSSRTSDRRDEDAEQQRNEDDQKQDD